ncbi:uncharacterized protein LDX57_007072 [Aspergillus melleus]|uniref:uncharacterized protein n=1 Tax=Aspergillus melleus TaxID=138277 RepID=UPI001E8DA490|nr:uncharacterized protein LDX57_007072 [Aspergillus melleus]KAH8429409.1 hypothetical protein LDX57_007072 [Aspergillus melleus]
MVDGEDEAKLADAPNPPIWSQQSSDYFIPQPHLQGLPVSHLPSAQESPSSQNPSKPLPPIPPRQPFIRLPLCTHSVVERQHCVNPYEQCESCGRIPFLGWFFVCVEDTSGFSDPLDPIRGPFLSPWILKAIETGQYTEEEREVLIQQKLRVLTMADLERAPSPSISMLEAEYGAEEPAMQQTASSPASPGASMTDLFPHPLPPLPCILRACRHCERRFANLEERSWGSINEICNDPAIGPPAAFELAGRPVSDASIVRNLGWRSAAVPVPTAETSEDCAEDSGQEGLGSVFDFQIDLTGDDLSSLVDQALDIVGKGGIKQDESADIDADESISNILFGVEIDDESELGGDKEAYGGVPLR